MFGDLTGIKNGPKRFWCYACGLRFNPFRPKRKIACPNCKTVVAASSDPVWEKGLAWCRECQLMFGILEQVGEVPTCPICKKKPNEIKTKEEVLKP